VWYPTGGNLWQSKTNDLGLTFVKACSDLWAIHQRKCKEWQKGGSLVAWSAMKSLLVGTGYNLCRVNNYHDSRACGYKRSGILFWLDGLNGDGMGLVKTFWDLWDTLCLCGHTYDMLKFNLIGSLDCNLNLVNSMLIINESCIGAFLLAALYRIYLVITFTYQLFLALAEYQP
jgi:hypothetical protein